MMRNQSNGAVKLVAPAGARRADRADQRRQCHSVSSLAPEEARGHRALQRREGGTIMSRFAVVLPILSLGFSYSQVAAADQTSEQIQRLLAPIAFYSDAPTLGTSTHSSEVKPDRWTQHSTLDFDELAQEVARQRWDSGPRAPAQSPSLLIDLNNRLSPEVANAPAYDFWHLEGTPIMSDPGWVPIQGGFIGPGISFGIGFPIAFLGGSGWSGLDR